VEKQNTYLKIDADALNRCRRHSCMRRTIYIYQGLWRQYAGNCACVYGICTVKKIKTKQIRLTVFPTYP